MSLYVFVAVASLHCPSERGLTLRLLHPFFISRIDQSKYCSQRLSQVMRCPGANPSDDELKSIIGSASCMLLVC